jgi:L-ornithine Nalpha-acyltransferase
MRTKVIGAGRLLLPNPRVALLNGWEHGLPIEEKIHIDLSNIGPPGSIGEVGRFCIEEGFRGTTALAELCHAMCLESARRGVKYWVSAANMDCDSEEEAHIIYGLLRRRGLLRADVQVTPRVEERPPRPPRFAFYADEAERRRAIDGDRTARLPRAVAADAALGARYIGAPLWDGYFGMYSIPLIAEVDGVLKVVERVRRAARRLRAR